MGDFRIEGLVLNRTPRKEDRTMKEGQGVKRDGERTCGRGRCGIWGKALFGLFVAGGLAGWITFLL
jgi:hypothetical protein